MKALARQAAAPGLLQSPPVLLLITGALLGMSFPLGKIAAEAGISAMMWSMTFSLGAAGILFPALFAKRRLSLPRGRTIRYIIISGLVSFVTPNLLLFSVIPHAGAGYTGLMFALSPVFTLVLAVGFRLKTPHRGGLIGIAVALVGAVVVSMTRGAAPEAPPAIWVGVALLIPLILACGNIYRTLDWPDKALPDVLAFWSHVFSVMVFLVLLWMTEGLIPLHELAAAPWLTLLQMFVAGLIFPAYFRLQQHGGPVLLSQIGYVAAAVGLVAATGFLGERYGAMTWSGAAVIALGMVVTIVAQIKER